MGVVTVETDRYMGTCLYTDESNWFFKCTKPHTWNSCSCRLLRNHGMSSACIAKFLALAISLISAVIESFKVVKYVVCRFMVVCQVNTGPDLVWYFKVADCGTAVKQQLNIIFLIGACFESTSKTTCCHTKWNANKCDAGIKEGYVWKCLVVLNHTLLPTIVHMLHECDI